jgi:hypothetical protein
MLQNNSTRTFTSAGENVYVTITGQEIHFTITPQSKIVSILNGPVTGANGTVDSAGNVTPGNSGKMALGDIMSSDSGSGIVTITNGYMGQQLVLDDHDPMNPVERLAR